MSSDRKNDPGEEQSSFKVTDRRAFTSEGERRTQDDPPPEAEPREEPAREPGTGAEPPPGPKETPEAAPPPPGEEAHRHTPRPSLDFITFLHSLSMTALMALGDVENPDTHRFETNLELARQNIDILVMLREKTEGNLSDEEYRFLHEIVPQLQLRYVEKAKGS